MFLSLNNIPFYWELPDFVLETISLGAIEGFSESIEYIILLRDIEVSRLYIRNYLLRAIERFQSL